MKTITTKLKIVNVEPNHWDCDGKLNALLIFFEFFADDIDMYVSAESVKERNQRFLMLEGELTESFEEYIEDYWDEIYDECQKCIDQFNKEMEESR